MRRNTSKIFTLSDARAERLLREAHAEARERKRDEQAAKKLLKALGLKSERKPHATGLHPRIGNLSRWDIDGSPFYYIWQGEDMITSTNVEGLMDYINAEAL